MKLACNVIKNIINFCHTQKVIYNDCIKHIHYIGWFRRFKNLTVSSEPILRGIKLSCHLMDNAKLVYVIDCFHVICGKYVCHSRFIYNLTIPWDVCMSKMYILFINKSLTNYSSIYYLLLISMPNLWNTCTFLSTVKCRRKRQLSGVYLARTFIYYLCYRYLFCICLCLGECLTLSYTYIWINTVPNANRFITIYS